MLRAFWSNAAGNDLTSSRSNAPGRVCGPPKIHKVLGEPNGRLVLRRCICAFGSTMEILGPRHRPVQSVPEYLNPAQM
jgi:hypothetical protein